MQTSSIVIFLSTTSFFHEGESEITFLQYGMSLRKSEVLLEYEETEFIPYRLHIDFCAVHLQKNLAVDMNNLSKSYTKQR